MADLNWCTSCDNAVSPFSESLYCSEQCLRTDALRNHPLLGYTYPEFTDFPRPSPQKNHTISYSSTSSIRSVSTSPALTATSSTCDSVHQLSPPKFDLLSSKLPPVTTAATAKPTHFNYFSIFDQQHQRV